MKPIAALVHLLSGPARGVRLTTACLMGLCWLAGCGGLSLVRIAQAPPAAGAPHIDRLVDLGALDLPDEGPLSTAHHDGRATPGEYLAILGDNLDRHSQVRLAGRELAHSGYVEGGLLVRVPRGLSPFEEHDLEVSGTNGAARAKLAVIRQLMGADSNGGKLRFVPLGPDRQLLQQPEGIAIPGVWAAAISPAGGVAWAIDYPSPTTEQGTGRERYECQLSGIHLGAAEQPRKLGQAPLTLHTPPSALAMLDRHTLVVLAERELVVLAVSLPAQAHELGRIHLEPPPTEAGASPRRALYTDLELFAGERPFAVALDVTGNRLTRVDLRDGRTPKVTGHLALAAAADLPLTVDLARDPDDPAILWVLMGPNFRVAGAKIKAGLNKLEREVNGLWARALGEKPAEPAVAAARGDASVSRLVQIRIADEALHITASRLLPPKFFPLSIKALPRGEQLVAGLGADVFDFAGVEANAKGLKQIIGVLRGSVQLGKVVHCLPDGNMRFRYEGLAIYFSLDALPDGKLLTTVLRPGVGGFPPSVKGDWGVEVEGIGFSLFRSLGYRSLLPPYSVGLIGLQ